MKWFDDCNVLVNGYCCKREYGSDVKDRVEYVVYGVLYFFENLVVCDGWSYGEWYF